MVRPRPDLFWDFIEEMDGRKKCKFCGQEFAGDTSISRIKWHLSGVKGRGVATCKQVPDDVRQTAYDAANKRQRTMPSSSNINEVADTTSTSPQAVQNDMFGNPMSETEIEELIRELQVGVERNLPCAEDANQDHMEIMDTETLQIIPRSITPERVPVDEYEIRVPEQNYEDLGIEQEVREERNFSGTEVGIQRKNRTRETSQPIHRSITLERPAVDEHETRGAAPQLLADEVGPVIENSWGAIHASTSMRNVGPIPTTLQVQNNEVAVFDDLQQFFAKLRRKWEERLLQIDAILDNTEQKAQTDMVIKIWLNKLRELAYDLEDILDEFETEDLKGKLKSGESQGSTSTVQPSAAMPNRSKLQDIDGRWEDIMKERNGLGLDINVGGSSKKVGQRRLTSSLLKEPKVYGRENDKEELVRLLMKEEPSNSPYSVIPVVGMGGIGKTTLAQYVYNDERMNFDYKAWVCASDDFDILRLTKMILLHWESCEADDLNVLQVKLKDKLHNKKFLIVLDDVWEHNDEDWTTLCGPFASVALGSKIIITTREKDVSLRMTSVDAYNLKELAYDECLCLFSQHALEAENFEAHPDLEVVGQKIVQRCKGLPLAAKTLGGLLRHNQDLEDWEDIFNSEMWELSEGESVILSALKLSYLHLPSHLKRCFAYCAIFPKDYEFDENELVLLWMAEGFLQQKKQRKDLGHKYFKELLSRSLFQQCSGNKSRFVMHDLISDLAQSVTGEICFHLDDKKSSGEASYAKVRHFSFTSHQYDTSLRFKALYEMESLRTFITIPKFSSYAISNHLSTKVLDDLVPKLKCLRALSLAFYTLKELPESISALKLLRYLNLSKAEIVRLPVSLGKLLNLQTLILRGCYELVELPASIGDLFNLQHLDVWGTYNLQEMPHEISKLKNLHFLPKFVVGEGNGLGIGELRRLNVLGIEDLMGLPHLQGQLCIIGLQNVTNIQDAKLANLKERTGLGELALKWCHYFHYERNESHEKQVLNSLQPHQSLEKLSIIAFGGAEFPLWVGDHSFSKMVDLQLIGCSNITSFPSLGKLPALKHLSISGMRKLRAMAFDYFPSLETMYIRDMLKCEQWYWSDGLNEQLGGKFPRLVELTLENCPVLIGKLPKCLPSLRKLCISRCRRLTNLPEMLPSLCELKVEYCHGVIFQKVPNFTSLVRFEIGMISGLVCLHDALVQALVALEYLVIKNCHELKYLWQDGVDLDKLANLKQLHIFNCMELLSLVEGMEGLLPRNLQILSFKSCYNLEKLPNGLHSVTSLRELIIEKCHKLVSFPVGAGLPYSLKSLAIQWCDSLESLPDGIMTMMNNNCSLQCLLEELKIYKCPSLKLFPNWKLPSTLKELSICDAHLEELSSWNMSMITSFPAAQYFPTFLKTLEIYCQKIKSLPSLVNLSHLTRLKIQYCNELDSFSDEELRLPNLLSLWIQNCGKLRSLPNHMDSLQELVIIDCSHLVSFPKTGFPYKLTSLHVTRCKNLRQPISQWRLHTLTSLKELAFDSTIVGNMMDYFPDEDGLLLPTSLTSLAIIRRQNLKSITRGILRLTFLESLAIEDCPKLHVLPKEGFPATLGSLSILECPLLKVEDHWHIIAHIPRVNNIV